MKIFVRLISVVLCCGALSVFAQDRGVPKGKELLKQGMIDEALAVLRRTSAIEPTNVEALYWLGQAYLKAAKPDSAEIIGLNLLSQNNKGVDGYLLVAEAETAQKEFSDAYIILRKGLKATKKNPLLLTQLGFVQLEHDSTEQAIVSFSQAKESDPNNHANYRGLGEAYLKLAANPIAIMQFEKSIELDSMQINLKYRLANLYMKERRYTEAAKMYHSVLQQNPEDDNAALELAKLYFAARQYANAARVLEPLANRKPNDQEIWLMYMDALYSSKQYTHAIEAAEHVLTLDANSKRALRVSARANFILKKYEESIASYQALSAVDTIDATDTKNWGKSHLELKMDSLGVMYLEKSLAMDSTQSDIFTELGAAYMRLRQWDLAAKMYSKKMVQDSSYATAYVNYALSNMQLAKWEEARKALYNFLILRPTYLQGHLYLARCLAQMDSLSSAVREYNTVVQLADTSETKYKTELGEAYKMMSLAYLIEKKYPPALESLTKAVSFKPDDVELHLWRAQTLHTLSKKDDAAREYKNVLRLDPNNKDAKKGLQLLEQYN